MKMNTKPKIKINFMCQPPANYYIQYFFMNLLKKDYDIVLSNKPDYVIYSEFDGKNLHPVAYKSECVKSIDTKMGLVGHFIKKCSFPLYSVLKKISLPVTSRIKNNQQVVPLKMPKLYGPFKKIFYAIENCRPEMDKCNWAFTFDYDEELNDPKHLRIPLYAIVVDEELVKHNVNAEKITAEKNKFCNFVYSNNVEFRNNFFHKLNKYKKVESWGKCCNNMGKLLPGGNWGKRHNNASVKFYKKKDFLKQYKFTIAFENSSYPGYTTEKITEPMLANSIPIYWGNPLVSRDFNTKSFLNYHDFESQARNKFPDFILKIPGIKSVINKIIAEKATSNLIKRIIEIDNNDELYEEYLKQPWYNNNKPSKYVDKKILIKRFHEIFDKNLKIKKIDSGSLNAKFYVRNNVDKYIIDEIWKNNEYSMFPDFDIKKDDVVIDIGANVGAFTVYASLLAKEVFAFEPEKENYEMLRKNIQLNSLKNVNLFNSVVSSVSGRIKLYLTNIPCSYGIFKMGNSLADADVKSVTLKEIFDSNKITRCNLLKIDTEGSEYDILASLPKEYFGLIDRIVLEYHDVLMADVSKKLIKFLSQNNYDIKTVPTNDGLGLIYARRIANSHSKFYYPCALSRFACQKYSLTFDNYFSDFYKNKVRKNVDRIIGIIGLSIKKLHPKLYHQLKKLKD